MTEEQLLLAEAREHARSFPGLVQPNDAVFIGAEENGGDRYLYYRDSTGNYYYDSERTRRFELETQKRKKERDRKRWRNRTGRLLTG